MDPSMERCLGKEKESATIKAPQIRKLIERCYVYSRSPQKTRVKRAAKAFTHCRGLGTKVSLWYVPFPLRSIRIVLLFGLCKTKTQLPVADNWNIFQSRNLMFNKEARKMNYKQKMDLVAIYKACHSAKLVSNQIQHSLC